MPLVRFGIIGCGVIAPWHAQAINDTQEAELAACCDIIEERAQRFSNDYSVPEVYTDYLDLLKSERVDAVCVCVPSGLHGAVTIDAAKAGKHVMCEKPVEITLPKIDEMLGQCRASNVKLGVIFQRRTSPMWHKIKSVIDSGALGRMVLGDAYLKYYRSQEYYDSGAWRGTWDLDGGGALMNQGVHMIDLLRWIMGPVESIYAHADHLARDIEVEDTACAVIRFKSGAMGVLEGATSVYPGVEHRLEFHGEAGSICVEGEKIKLWDVPGDNTDCEALCGCGGVDVKIGTSQSAITPFSAHGHTVLIKDLCRAIATDAEPMVSGEEARKAVEVVLAVYESARTGNPVKMQS